MLPAELDDDVPDPDEVPLADDRLDATLDDTLDASEVMLLSTLLTMLLATPLALLRTLLRGLVADAEDPVVEATAVDEV